jgi:hypothetical protein
MQKKYLVGLFTLSFSLQLMALETDWIDLKKGSADKSTGTTIRDVSKSEKEGNTTVTVAIPKSAVANPQSEEVVVYGKAEEKAKKEPVIDISYEWVEDYEHDNYGLIIKFGKDPVLPIRLYLKSSETNKINP